jgi:hypothetical protein
MPPPPVSVAITSAPAPTPTVKTMRSPCGVSQKTGALAMKPGGETGLPSMNTRCTGVPAT